MAVLRHYSLLLVFFPLVISAQKIKIVETEYTYCAPSSMSPLEAKAEAVKIAQAEAIAEQFGRIVTSNNYLRMLTENDRTQTLMNTIGESEVKGEWIKDLESPKILNMSIQDDMSTCITVHVKGEAMEITTAPVNFEVKMLKSDIDDRIESDDFKAGDKFYMSFRSPVNGYLAIYMIDDEGKAFRLLPYPNSEAPSFKIKHDKKYILFSENNGGQSLDVFCEREIEFNHIYTLFSPHPFTRSLDNGVTKSDSGRDLPPVLSLRDFQKWFTGIRKYDKDLSVDRRTFRITKQ